jgi:cytochrome P450
MLTIFSLLALCLILAWLLIRIWYFRLVAYWRTQIHHLDGRIVPGETPRMLMGNLVDVYRSKNRLSAYHLFNEKFGEIVQIFWMWRQQISIANYDMARHILVSHQKNYQKYPPNSLIQQLYGSSVLTNSGDDWKRHRLLMQEVFSRKHVTGFHDIFVSYSEQLAAKWDGYIKRSPQNAPLNIYPDAIALFLDIVGKTAIGHDFGALNGEANEFLENLQYILNQSTRPVHQFTKWWKHLPLPSNRRLAKAFASIDNFLNELIRQRREMNQQSTPDSYNVLDLLLHATDLVEDDVKPLTDKEVRDNLLAIIVNGHETVATSVSLSLYLLARHPDKLAVAQAEVDRVMERGKGQLTKAGFLELHYLDSVVHESLRMCPPMAGLQRVSVDKDVLEGWSIPEKQPVAITLTPLHRNPQDFGTNPEQFHPERYLDLEQATASVGSTLEEESPGKCPMKWVHALGKHSKGRTRAGICLPLTFGDGVRKCLGEHFAMYEMKVVLAVLLHRFNFQLAPNFELDLELGKFGLFISMFPQGGIDMIVSDRQH